MALDNKEVLDLSKENIQSTRSGRKAIKLYQENEISEEVDLLLKQKLNLERKIRVYIGEDPIQPYYEYTTWLEENYAKIGEDRSLISLYEEILEIFRNQELYKQDERFVQILVKYISAQADALELYELVYEQGLGKQCSTFYQSWAKELDKNNEFKKADQVYQLGIKNQTQRLQQLSDAHIQFQLSLARRLLDGNIDITSLLSMAKKDTKTKASSKNRFSNLLKSNINDQGSTNKFCGAQRIPILPRKSIEIPLKVLEDTEMLNDFVKRIDRKSSVVKTKKDEFKCPLAIFEPEDVSKKPMYPKHLVYVDGCDIQLEEIMAACYLKRMINAVTEEPVEDDTNLVKSKTVSNLKLSEKSSSVISDARQKRTFSESNVTNSLVEEQSWYLKTEFIKPVKLPVTTATAPPLTDEPAFVPLEKMEQGFKNLIIKPGLPKNLRKSIHSKPHRVEDEALDFSIHSNKANVSSFHHSPSSSMTVNTREVLNMVDKWWRSPSAPPQAKISKQMDEFESFKKPVSRKSQFFKPPHFHDEIGSNLISAAPVPKAEESNLPFVVYKDESIRDCKVEENKGPIQNEESVEPCQQLISTNSKKIDGDVLSPPLESVKLSTDLANENKTTPTLVLPIKLRETPLKAEDKENLPPLKQDPEIIIGIPGMQINLGDDSGDNKHDLFDETCSTNAFAVLLPSSTPFSRSNQKKNRRSSMFNSSYTNETETNPPIKERKQSFGGLCINPTNLSLILENSKEQGYSSSNGNIVK